MEQSHTQGGVFTPLAPDETAVFVHPTFLVTPQGYFTAAFRAGASFDFANWSRRLRSGVTCKIYSRPTPYILPAFISTPFACAIHHDTQATLSDRGAVRDDVIVTISYQPRVRHGRSSGKPCQGISADALVTTRTRADFAQAHILFEELLTHLCDRALSRLQHSDLLEFAASFLGSPDWITTPALVLQAPARSMSAVTFYQPEEHLGRILEVAQRSPVPIEAIIELSVVDTNMNSTSGYQHLTVAATTFVIGPTPDECECNVDAFLELCQERELPLYASRTKDSTQIALWYQASAPWRLRPETRDITHTALASLSPPSYPITPTVLGLTKHKRVVHKSQSCTDHWLITGDSGTGKSLFAAHLATEGLSTGSVDRVIVLDTSRDYRESRSDYSALREATGGALVTADPYADAISSYNQWLSLDPPVNNPPPIVQDAFDALHSQFQAPIVQITLSSPSGPTTPWWLEAVYTSLFKQRLGIRTMVIIDSAHHVMQSTSSAHIVERMLREGRKHGVSLLLVTQSVSDLAPSLMGQIPHYMMFRQRTTTPLYAHQSLLGDAPNILPTLSADWPSREALYLSSGTLSPVTFCPSNVLYWLTTNRVPDSLRKEQYLSHYTGYSLLEVMHILSIDYPQTRPQPPERLSDNEAALQVEQFRHYNY